MSRAAAIVCPNAWTSVEFVKSCAIEVSSARCVTGLILYPTGCCIHEFAARMKYAEAVDPIATSQIVARCTFGFRRSQPKIQSPRNVDSMKNAASPSIASGAPKMSPT